MPSAITSERNNLKRSSTWKWIVVLGSHITHLLVWGIIRSTGVLLVEWKRHFDTGAAVVSSVASVMSASLLLTGPVAGYLCKRYGCRPVTLLGGALSALGFLTGSFAQSVPHLCVAVGGLTGMGFSLAYTASAVVPGLYFDKRFALANGISSTGVGVGVLIIPPLLQILIDEYGWRGCMLVMSAMLANICACGAVFRPIPSRTRPLKKEIDDGTYTNEHMDDEILPTISLDIHSERVKIPSNPATYEHSEPGLVSLVTNNDNVDLQDQEDDNHGANQSKDVCQHGQQTKRQYFLRILTNGIKCVSKAIGLHLFTKSYRFLILCITQMLVGLSFSGVVIHIVNHIRLVDTRVTSVEVSLIISIVGTGSLLARLTHGFLVDRNLLTPIVGYGIGVMGTSTVILVSPAIKQYPWFAVYGGVLGFGIGLNMSLLRVLVKDYLGVKDLAQGIGLSAVVFIGTGELIGPLLSGWLYDTTGNYTTSFFVMGAILFTAGPMMLLLPILKQLDLKRKGCDPT